MFDERKKMGRKPKYENPQTIIDMFFAAVSDSYRHPGKDEVGDVSGRKKQELLAEEFGISRIKVRKILITTGDIKPPVAISSLITQGVPLAEVSQKLNISKSTVNSWVRYSKGVYGLDVSAAADRAKTYRVRKEAVAQLKENMDELALWRCVCLFQGYPFTTSGRKIKDGVKRQEQFKYVVSEPGSSGGRHYEGPEVEAFGNELFIIPASGEGKGKRREKGTSRSSVDYAFSIVRDMDGKVTGPKQLKVYGSSYVFAIFKQFGLITPVTEEERGGE